MWIGVFLSGYGVLNARSQFLSDWVYYFVIGVVLIVVSMIGVDRTRKEITALKG